MRGALTVSPYRDAIAYVRLNFGGSYWQATWLDDEGKWQISYKWRLTSNGSYATYNYKSEPNEDVVISQTTYEHVTNNGDVTAELLVSTSPTTVSVMLPGASNSNHVDQGVENYVGSGSGSGQIVHEYTGIIKLTPQVKVKTP